MKTKKWLVALLVVAAVAALGLTLFFTLKSRTPKTVTLTDDGFMDALPTATLDGTTEFRQSDIPGVFYTMDPIAFYEYKDGALAPAKDVKTLPVEMSIFNQKIKFELKFIRRGTRVTGYGEYSEDPDKAATTLISDYYFIHAITLPGSVKIDKSKNCLLLIDSKKEAPEDPLRVYEETYFLNTQTGKSGGRYIPDANRTIDIRTGGKRRDYAMFTTEQVKNATSKRTLYFSRMNYDYDAQDTTRMDLRNIIGTYTDFAAYQVDYKYARDTENGLMYLRKNGGSFEVVYKKNSKETTAMTLPGDLEQDYLRSGDWFFPVKDIAALDKVTVTNIATKETKEVAFATRLREVSAFSVSPDGTKLVLAGKAVTADGSDKQTVLFCEITGTRQKQLVGSALFSNLLPSFYWLDNADFAFNCTDFEKNQPQLCVCSFENALKSNTAQVTKKADASKKQ